MMADGPSKAQVIRTLAMKNVAPRDIANQTGIDYDYVRSEVSRARRAGTPIKQFRRLPTEGARFLGEMPWEARAALLKAAFARNLSAVELANRIVTVVASENMFDAVLDGWDGE